MESFAERMNAISAVKGIADKDYIVSVLGEIEKTPAYFLIQGKDYDVRHLNDTLDSFIDAEQEMSLSEYLLLMHKSMEHEMDKAEVKSKKEELASTETAYFIVGFMNRRFEEHAVKRFGSINYGAFMDHIRKLSSEGEKVYNKTIIYSRQDIVDYDDTIESNLSRLYEMSHISWLPSQSIASYQSKIRNAYKAARICFFDPLCFYYSMKIPFEELRFKYIFDPVPEGIDGFMDEEID